MDKLKIKVSIAGRVYPLTINREEEENIRKAASKIEAIVKQFESNYAVKDKQDLLAMCALQLSSKVEETKGKTLLDEPELENNIDALEADITALLNRSLT
ncbi:MAG: cell division protein ZapA [Flavobacteriales bacterium]|jgi:cell division protein ZapA|tara:strand:+ start:6862 stop:7161 length:300 start_codon:yes stop_codon:yes gene_type:complete